MIGICRRQAAITHLVAVSRIPVGDRPASPKWRPWLRGEGQGRCYGIGSTFVTWRPFRNVKPTK